MSLNAHVRNHDIGISQRAIRTPVGHDAQPLGEGRVREATRTLILGARYQQAPGDHTARELNEDLLELLARMIAIQVIGFNVRHDLDRRRIVQERAIRLVGLSDENIAATQVRAGPQLRQNATHRYGRIQPTGRQSDRQHAGRRRLPVRSGHADETHTGSRQRESLRTVNHQLTALTSNRQLGVVLTDSSRHDDHRRRIHVRSIVPDEDTHTHRAQVVENRRILAV